MIPTRLLLALSCLTFAAFLVRCGGSATCEDCGGPAGVGLTVFAPAAVATGSCAPAQVVQLDGGVAVRPSVPVKLGLSGDTTWYADPACTVASQRVTQAAGSRGAVAYFAAAKTGKLAARVRGETAGGEMVVEASERSGSPAGLQVAGVRYSDVSGCAPIWVAAVDAGGRPAGVTSDVVVTLAAAATTFFATPSCGSQLTTLTLTSEHQSAIAYARFGVPGDITVNATATGLGSGSTHVDVAGDPQFRLAVEPQGEALPVQAGECKSFALTVVDPTGAVLPVDALPVTFTLDGTSVFSDSSCAAPITSTVVRGGAPTTVYVQATQAGSASATFVIADSQARTVGLQVRAGAASRVHLAGPARLALGGCYPYVVERTDAYGNAVKGPSLVANISSGLSLFSDAACAGAATDTTAIPEGGSFGRFYIQGTALASAAALHADATGLAAESITVAVVAAAVTWRFDFADSLAAGDCIGATLTTVDGTGTPADTLTTATAAFTPSSPRLAVYANAACTIPIVNLAVPGLAHSSVFYLSSRNIGAYTLGATSAVLGAVPARPISVRAALAASIESVASARIDLARCVPVTLRLRDRFGNASPASQSTQLALGAPSQGEYFADAACTSPIQQATVPLGDSDVVVYYRGRAIGSELFTARATGLTSSPVFGSVVFFMSDIHAPLADAAVVRELGVTGTGSLLYAHTLDGVVWRSDDVGASWVAQCIAGGRSGLGSLGNIMVSPAPDATAYVAASGDFYRVEQRGVTVACPSIRPTDEPGPMYAYYATSSISVDAAGIVWAWLGNNLYYSDSRGAFWYFIYTESATDAPAGFMVHHPADLSIMVVDHVFGSIGGGLYQSANRAASFSPSLPVGFNDPYRTVHFDSAHPGYAYATGQQSIDNGSNWTANAGYNGLSIWWGVDAAGAAYRLTGDTSNTVVQRAPDARTPVWAALPAGTLPHSFDDDSAQMAMSPSASVIAVQTGGYAYVTTNAGVSFPRLPSPGNADSRPLYVAGASATNGYAVSDDPFAFATGDGGATWTYRGALGSYNGSPPYVHVNPSFPLTVYVRSETFGYTYERKVSGTQDGFASIETTTNAGSLAPSSAGAVSLTDPLVFYTVGESDCRRTLDGASYDGIPCEAVGSYAAPDGWVSPVDHDIVWYVAGDGDTSHLSQLDWRTGAVVDLTPRARIRPAAVELVQQGAGYVMRVVSERGGMVTSNDLGATFGSPTPEAGFVSCPARLLTSLASNHQVMAQACANDGTVLTSRDGGSTWRSTFLPSCNVRQLAVFDAAVVASCYAAAPQTIVF